MAVVLFVTACGASDGESPEPKTTDLGACLNCNSTPPPRTTPSMDPASDVSAEPGSLMFYVELTENMTIPTQVVTIKNSTASMVLLTGTQVVDDVQSRYGHEAARYFTVQGPQAEVTLLPGASVDFTVSFSPSAETREALLVIETTDEETSEVVVDLSGKYFTPTSITF